MVATRAGCAQQNGHTARGGSQVTFSIARREGRRTASGSRQGLGRRCCGWLRGVVILVDLRRRFIGAVRLGAVIVPIAVAAVLAALGSSITTATATLVLVLVVVAFAAVGDRAAGLLAAVSSGLWFDFFLTEPLRQFAISDPDDVEVVVLLVVVGAAVGEIAMWGQRQNERAARRRGYLDGVLETADPAATAGVSAEELARRTGDRIIAVLEVDRCRFVPDAVPPRAASVLRRDGSVHRDGVDLAVEREGLPTDVETWLAAPAAHGCFRITAASRVARPTREQRRVAVLLAAQFAAGASGSGERHPPALTPPG